jgi:hypothetical protein
VPEDSDQFTLIVHKAEQDMTFQPDQITLLIACLLALILMGIVTYLAVIKAKARTERRRLKVITAALLDYFQKTGLEVTAGCTVMSGSQAFTAVIESEPMKRFRLSHIIEIALREHVRKTCGLELGKVYWRFPIKDAPASLPVTGTGTTDIKALEKTDNYINEGLEYYKYIPKVEVTEMSWEHFEKVSTIEAGSAAAATESGNAAAIEKNQTRV